MPAESKPRLIEQLLFGIAAIIDGAAAMEVDGKRILPRLTFATDDDGEELISCGGGSNLHEFVHGFLESKGFD